MLKERVDEVFGLTPPFDDWVKEEAVEPEMFVERLAGAGRRSRSPRRSREISPEDWIQIEKSILLQSLDHHWKEHLSMLDALRQVVHLRAYAQKKPIDEYKHEAFAMFERMLGDDPRGRDRHARPRPLHDAAARTCRRLPDFLTQHIDPFTGEDDTADIDAGTGAILSRLPPLLAVPGACRAMPTTSTRSRRRPAATRPARAARAASTSTATAPQPERKWKRRRPFGRRRIRATGLYQASFIPSLLIIALSLAFCSSESWLRNFGKTSSSSIRICSLIIDRKSRIRASHSALSFGIVSSS